LLVAVGIIGLLAALILPATMQAQAAARQVQCRNNMRNIGLALISSAESRGRFPAFGHWTFVKPGRPYHTWVVTILPWLEQKNIYDQWEFGVPYPDSTTNQQLAQTHLSVLTCPADITVEGKADLSYAVNGGFGDDVEPCGVSTVHGKIDLNADGICEVRGEVPEPNDYGLLYQTGIFFDDTWPDGYSPHHSVNTIVDGATQTIMLAENVRAGFDPFAPDSGWAYPTTRREVFYLSPRICENLTCGPGMVDSRKANDGIESINSGLNEPERSAPWPASFHSGGVNVLFVDGRVQFLSQDIDGPVYAALISPQGSRIEGPLRQIVVTDGF